jgi:transcriptional regulator with XRE-family HTH domain
MTNSIIHRGEIVEKILRKSGYSITKLAKKLGISRNTLYNRFKNADLSYRFIMEVGKVLYYDFTIDFPAMKEDIGLLEKDQTKELWRIERKYTELLEKHAKLVATLVKLANENELAALHQEIAQMIEKEKEAKV